MCQFYGIGADTSKIKSVMATQTFLLIILETLLGIKYEFHFLLSTFMSDNYLASYAQGAHKNVSSRIVFVNHQDCKQMGMCEQF